MNNKELDRFVIEFSGQALGLVIRDDHGFVFFAAAEEMWPLNRRVFSTVDAATKASLDLLHRKRHPAIQKIAAVG